LKHEKDGNRLKLFGRKTKGVSSVPDSFEEGKPITILAGLAQSVGKIRDHMEDAAISLLAQQGIRGQERRAGLFVVADGMGGHFNGEMASSIAVEKFVESVDLLSIVVSGTVTDDILVEKMESAVNKAQEAVLENVKGGGSTLTAALLLDRELVFAHVGDSRLYLINKTGAPEQLTRDHSLVQRLVDLGQINAAEAEIHPQKNVLYRALGQTDGFKVDVGQKEICKPGHLLLCSDGLWGLVNESKIVETVRASSSVEKRAQDLCDLANEAGGSDNISVIVVDVF
jgi:serine/threonine protein phosphatase PrpC